MTDNITTPTAEIVERLTREAEYNVHETPVPGLYLTKDRNGDASTIDLSKQLAEHDGYPARKTGTFTVGDTGSFTSYLNKHALPDTETWANRRNNTIRAVINAHGGADDHAGFSDHTITLQLRHTPDWEAWTNYDNRLIPQAEFAEHVEDQSHTFTTPDPVIMLELAQTFHAHRGVEFKSSKRLNSGETQLTYHEDTTATAGRNADISIPDTFDLALQPYEHGPTYRCKARLRYRITNGQLLLGYKLIRLDRVLDDAFDAVINEVQDEVDCTIWRQD